MEGSYTVSQHSDACYTCVAGDYEVSVRFNEEHIPDSPFVVPVASPSDDARRLTVAGLQVRLRDTHTPRTTLPTMQQPGEGQRGREIDTDRQRQTGQHLLYTIIIN